MPSNSPRLVQWTRRLRVCLHSVAIGGAPLTSVVKTLMNGLIRYVTAFGFAFAAIILAHSQGYILPNGMCP
jgi:hypothetical protein